MPALLTFYARVFLATLFAVTVSLFATRAHAASEELPPLVLREAATGASLSLDHACLLEPSAQQPPACAIFQKKGASADEQEVPGKHTAIVRTLPDAKTGEARYFSATLASFEIPGHLGERRARAVLARMDGVVGSTVVTLNGERFLRVTSELPNGVSVMFLAIDLTDRQLALDFAGPAREKWSREELEATAATVMTTFARPAPATPTASSQTSAASSLLVGFVALLVLASPFALFALRLFVRRALRNAAEAREFAQRPSFQVAGSDCAGCGDCIVFERDGGPCRMCGGFVHHQCAPAHLGAHG